MSLGKYSPTVSASYARDQKWWERNGGGYTNGKNPNSENDDDGFDSYGYHDHDGPDRAGHTEDDYLEATIEAYREADEAGIEDFHDEGSIYFEVAREWRTRVLGDLAR